MFTRSLDILSDEFLHRILDLVNAETVFSLLPNVCRRFYTVICSYNQLKLDFQPMTKLRFPDHTSVIVNDRLRPMHAMSDERIPSPFSTMYDTERYDRNRLLEKPNMILPSTTVCIIIRFITSSVSYKIESFYEYHRSFFHQCLPNN